GAGAPRHPPHRRRGARAGPGPGARAHRNGGRRVRREDPDVPPARRDRLARSAPGRRGPPGGGAHPGHGPDDARPRAGGADRDGRIRGLRAFVIQDIGAYASEAATLPPLTGLMASGPYRIPRIDFHAVAVVTTTTPVGAYRGAGRPEATFLLERSLDMLA